MGILVCRAKIHDHFIIGTRQHRRVHFELPLPFWVFFFAFMGKTFIILRSAALMREIAGLLHCGEGRRDPMNRLLSAAY
jgi:hypothetical protein